MKFENDNQGLLGHTNNSNNQLSHLLLWANLKPIYLETNI